MKKPVMILSILIAVTVISFFIAKPFLQSFRSSFRKGYEESLLGNFRESFMKSCVAGDPSPRKTALCACVVDRAVRELSVKQLSDQAFALDYIKKNIAPVCLEMETAR